jgi:hypothetical protein
MSHKTTILIIAVVIAVIVGIGALYQWLVPGLSSARTEPGQVETRIATWLLHRSVPAEAAARIDPVKDDAAEIAAGSALFKQKCEICHAYDGSGKTQTGSGEYPRPPPLRVTVASILTEKSSTTFATVSETPACRLGICLTGKSGSSLHSSGICRTSHR